MKWIYFVLFVIGFSLPQRSLSQVPKELRGKWDGRVLVIDSDNITMKGDVQINLGGFLTADTPNEIEFYIKNLSEKKLKTLGYIKVRYKPQGKGFIFDGEVPKEEKSYVKGMFDFSFHKVEDGVDVLAGTFESGEPGQATTGYLYLMKRSDLKILKSKDIMERMDNYLAEVHEKVKDIQQQEEEQRRFAKLQQEENQRLEKQRQEEAETQKKTEKLGQEGAEREENAKWIDGTNKLFAGVKTKLTLDEKIQIFKLTGWTNHPDEGHFQLGDDELSKDYPFRAEVYPVDFNNDGEEEVFISYGNTFTSGRAGSSIMLLIPTVRGYKKNFDFEGLVPGALLPYISPDYPELLIGGPGFSFPIWKWDGQEYRYRRQISDAQLGNVETENIMAISQAYQKTI